jgi:hypothetical protein
VVLRNLVVDESAKFLGGYAFQIDRADNIILEDSEAYRAGKHHIGALQANNFVGRRLYAAWAMPDQGYGRATTYVSYSDFRFSGHVSTWQDVTSEELSTMPYPAFINHGTGLAEVTVRNLVARGGRGVALYTEGQGQRVRMLGGLLEDSAVSIRGDGILVDGTTLRGPNAGIYFSGPNRGNVVQNVVIDGARSDFGYYAAIVDEGNDNTVRFSTIRLDPSAPAHNSAFTLISPNSRTNIYGNIIDAPSAVRLWYAGDGALTSDRNLYVRPPRFIQAPVGFLTLDQWQARGHDTHSLVGDPLFANAAAGDFRLLPGSPAIDAYPDPVTGLLTDFDGRPRPQGAAYDLGAFESQPAAGRGGGA